MDRKHTLPLLALIAALSLLPPAAIAQDAAPTPTAGGPTTVTDRPDAQSDSLLGGLAAVGCGVFVRATLVTGGTQVGTIVGAVACCGFMVFDALVLDPR